MDSFSIQKFPVIYKSIRSYLKTCVVLCYVYLHGSACDSLSKKCYSFQLIIFKFSPKYVSVLACIHFCAGGEMFLQLTVKRILKYMLSTTKKQTAEFELRTQWVGTSMEKDFPNAIITPIYYPTSEPYLPKYKRKSRLRRDLNREHRVVEWIS